MEMQSRWSRARPCAPSVQRTRTFSLCTIPRRATLCRALGTQPQQQEHQTEQQQGPQHDQHQTCSSPQCNGAHISLCERSVETAIALLCAGSLLTPAAALASEGTLTGQSVELFRQFLERVEELGPWGGVVFVVVVMLFEMVPLFPTQPLSLASGLLFGPQKGSLLMLAGVTLAAVNAFLIARGVGRPLAQKVIDAEMSHSDNEEGGAMSKTLADVQAAIESGGLWKQLTAITLLRLTPVVPFSASNYLLGLTPVQLPAFLGGTLIGMSVWSTLYASLGGASRVLLDKGADLETLLADLGEKASAVSSNAVALSIAVAVAGAVAFGIRIYNQRQTESDKDDDDDNNGSLSRRDRSSRSRSRSPSVSRDGNGRKTPVSSFAGRGSRSSSNQGD